MAYSFEFFPPKTDEQRQQLDRTVEKLAPFAPRFVSVTFGAGGSTLSYTPETVRHLRDRHGLDAAPHLSCVGGTRDEIRALLRRYQAMGCTRLVALRGDLPSGMGSLGELRYAEDLVRLVRAEFADAFHIEVGAYPEVHPQADDAIADLKHFANKMAAGADSAITQYFYNADAYYFFREQCEARGVTVPIVPGVMPITRFTQLARFSDACGAEIPRWIRRKLESFGDDTASIRSFGLDVVTRLCDDLLRNGAPGLHFYTLNQAGAVTTLWQRLGL